MSFGVLGQGEDKIRYQSLPLNFSILLTKFVLTACLAQGNTLLSSPKRRGFVTLGPVSLGE